MRPTSEATSTATEPDPGGKPLQPSTLRRVLRWLWSHVHNLYAAGGVMLVAGLVVALIALWGLSALAEEVLEGETLRFDEAVLHWLARFTSERMDGLALEVTALGSWLVVLAIAVIAATLLALLGERWYALLLSVAVSGAWIIGPALKGLFGRDRPQVVEWRVPHAGLSSFPSGHSTMGMVLFLTVAYILHRIARRRWLTVVVMVSGTIVVALIGLTRLYLGVHYPSDVLAGYAVGFAWSMFCAAGVELVRSERMRTRPEEPPPEEPPPEETSPPADAEELS